MSIRHHWTINDWQFGFGFGLPTKSEFPLHGYKVKHPFSLYLFLGPLSIDLDFGDREYTGYTVRFMGQYPGDESGRVLGDDDLPVVFSDEQSAIEYINAISPINREAYEVERI